jgi:metal-responsive CopG/Arc/MetJ family transcriptional regulator
MAKKKINLGTNFNLRISASLSELVDEYSEYLKIGKSKFVRDAIEEKIAKEARKKIKDKIDKDL